MNAQPLSDLPAAEESRCSVHSDRLAVGACTRCGAFYCAEDRRVLHGQDYCATCAARPDVDYLEGFRLKVWGKRDAWAWLVGLGAVVGALGALVMLSQGDSEQLLAVLFGLSSAGVGVCFWLGMPWARLAFVLMRVVGVCLGFATMEAEGIGASLVPLIVSLIIYNDTRNKLFFKEEVSREALQKAWHLYQNNPLARGGMWAGIFGLLIPGVAILALVCSIIALRRVDPHATPPVGRKGQAIAGIVLGTLGLGTSIIWATSML
jgi:hypothetical protein